MPGESRRICANANRESGEVPQTITPRDNAAELALSERGRRVGENVRAEKKRLNPDRAQCWEPTKFKCGSRNRNQRCYRRMIIMPRSDKRDRARMVRTFRIRMNALVKLRRGGKDERPKKSGGGEACGKSTNDRAASHWTRASARLTTFATTFSSVATAVLGCLFGRVNCRRDACHHNGSEMK